MQGKVANPQFEANHRQAQIMCFVIGVVGLLVGGVASYGIIANHINHSEIETAKSVAQGGFVFAILGVGIGLLLRRK